MLRMSGGGRRELARYDRRPLHLVNIQKIRSISPLDVADFQYSHQIQGVILHTLHICTLIFSIYAGILKQILQKSNNIMLIDSVMKYIVSDI